MNLTAAKGYLHKDGVVGVIPTDTVYGLVARASDKAAVARLYALKERDSKPGTVIAASIDQLVDLGLKRRYLTAVADYWPAPLSIIIPCDKQLEYLHLGKMGLAIRIQDNQDLLDLLKDSGPLLTSSANLANQPTVTNIQEAKRLFGDKADFYIDGGEILDHQPSTIIRVVDDAIEVIRQGAFKIDAAA